jgi:1,4-alpha-glucan branching enzyme
MARKAEIRKKQRFQIEAPKAGKVLLVGDFTQWQQGALPMQRGEDGIWRAALELSPGKHAYRFIVDGVWCDDPQCTSRVPNPYGSMDMVRQVA